MEEIKDEIVEAPIVAEEAPIEEVVEAPVEASIAPEVSVDQGEIGG